MSKIRLNEKQLSRIISLSVRKILTEGVNMRPVDKRDPIYYFALSKINNKIVYSWPKSCTDKRMMKEDLEDNDLNPRFIKIYNLQTMMRIGIDPNDDSNWSDSMA